MELRAAANKGVQYNLFRCVIMVIMRGCLRLIFLSLTVHLEVITSVINNYSASATTTSGWATTYTQCSTLARSR